MKSSHMGFLKVGALGLVLAGLLFPVSSGAYPTDTDTYQIRAVRVGFLGFDDPTGPANNPVHPVWRRAPITTVDLQYKITASANALAPIDIDTDTAGKRVLRVKAIHDGYKLLVRVQWRDATRNETVADTPLFFDAVALAIPYQGPDYPACIPGPTQPEMIHMGTRCDKPGEVDCCPMNIMYWRPDKAEVENIVTNSPGTTKETAETDIEGVFHVFQDWNAGWWTVIMGRVLIAPTLPPEGPPTVTKPGRNLVDLVPGNDYPTVFASWDGGRQERNGNKYTGLWGTLSLDP